MNKLTLNEDGQTYEYQITNYRVEEKTIYFHAKMSARLQPGKHVAVTDGTNNVQHAIIENVSWSAEDPGVCQIVASFTY